MEENPEGYQGILAEKMEVEYQRITERKLNNINELRCINLN